jgi:hypothetical protein
MLLFEIFNCIQNIKINAECNNFTKNSLIDLNGIENLKKTGKFRWSFLSSPIFIIYKGLKSVKIDDIHTELRCVQDYISLFTVSRLIYYNKLDKIILEFIFSKNVRSLLYLSINALFFPDECDFRCFKTLECIQTLSIKSFNFDLDDLFELSDFLSNLSDTLNCLKCSLNLLKLKSSEVIATMLFFKRSLKTLIFEKAVVSATTLFPILNSGIITKLIFINCSFEKYLELYLNNFKNQLDIQFKED